jgi:hypothetical protein
MKTKTSDLIGPALDWAVAKCEGWVWKTGLTSWYGNKPWLERYTEKGTSRRQLWELTSSTDWWVGGPIIEREGLGFYQGNATKWWAQTKGAGEYSQEGPTPLIAAMRCYVASKLGDEIDIPEELT